MVGEIVEHVRYGRGVVTGFEATRISVRFDADAMERRFAYPVAVERFLKFERPEAADRARRDMASSRACKLKSDQERSEAKRRRDEAEAALRMELMRKKRVDAARQAAERRRLAVAAKKREA